MARPEYGIPGDIVLGESKYPDAIPLRYTDAEIAAIKGQRIDKDTGQAINAAAHPYAGIEEQLGILRVQIAEILNYLGLAPTADFDNLNAIAAEKIQEAAVKKEML